MSSTWVRANRIWCRCCSGRPRESASTRYLNASPELRTSLRHRLVGNLGDAAESILRFIESGADADALALAVVCQVVFGEGNDSTLEAAAARMEQYHSNKPIAPSIGRCLGGAATDAIADLDRKEDSHAVPPAPPAGR